MTERLTAIVGPMFSEKTTELLRMVNKAEFAKRAVIVFKPSVDDRWGLGDKVRTHGGKYEHEAIGITDPKQILECVSENTKLVAIDEIQFMDSSIIDVIDELLERNIEVAFAGLPTDFRNEPFGPVPNLLAKSDTIQRLSSICSVIEENGENCREAASRTQRFINTDKGQRPASYNDPIVIIGAEESYQARCPSHHEVSDKPVKI